MDQMLEQKQLKIDPLDYQEAWEMVLIQLRMEMSRGAFDTWVQPLRPLSFKEGVFRVAAVNIDGRDWVESRLGTRIKHLLASLLHQELTVSFTLAGSRAASSLPPLSAAPAAVPAVAEKPAGNGHQKKSQPAPKDENSPRKMQLQRAYGSQRASIIQPERGMFLTMYFFNNWLPLLGHSACTAILAARSLCYWNPMTGELRNVVETDMAELARRASVSVRTIKDVLNNDLVKRYFLRYKVRRVMTPNGVRTAGIILQVRMDDPLTPEDQLSHDLPESERWYTADFEDEGED